MLPQGSGSCALRLQLAKVARDPPAPALLWHHPICPDWGDTSTDGPRGGYILLTLLGPGQLPRARNPPGSPVPPPTPAAHHPVNRRRFPGTSLGCSKRKFPAVRHLPTPSMEVFRLVAAPRVGRGVLLSHMLPGRPHGDPHTAPGCHPGSPGLPRRRVAAALGEKPRSTAVLPGRGTQEQPHHGGRHPAAEEGTCRPRALRPPPYSSGWQELLPAPRARAFQQGDSSLVRTGPTTWLDSLQLLDLSSPSLWAFPLEMKA